MSGPIPKPCIVPRCPNEFIGQSWQSHCPDCYDKTRPPKPCKDCGVSIRSRFARCKDCHEEKQRLRFEQAEREEAEIAERERLESLAEEMDNENLLNRIQSLEERVENLERFLNV